MAFRADKQTISDIELFSHNEKTPSLFGYYNRTITFGGKEKLFKIIQIPVSDIESHENRKREIEYFFHLKDHLKLNRRQFDYIEYYLASRRIPLRNNIIDATWDRIANKLKSDNDYYTIREGIVHLSGALIDLKKFLSQLEKTDIPDTLAQNFSSALNFLNSKTLADLIQKPISKKRLKSKSTNKLDHFYRKKVRTELREVMNTIYQIDMLQSLSGLIKTNGFTMPEYVTDEGPVFELENGFHPLLKDPQANSFNFSEDHSLCFVTGPNMSGKSTFLKTVALIIYFAHLGLPVPATRLRISVFEGLFTTINLSDSISQGFSHFYAEVNRVKEMALGIQENRNIVVVLDELFRGTNVKDAFDGTLMVIHALSRIKGALFFISSHILEVAEHLNKDKRIDFKCFESILDDDTPVYNYNLKDGISAERVGLQIIKNENIENILNGIIEDQAELK